MDGGRTRDRTLDLSRVEGNALPLSYAPGTIMPTAGLSAGRHIGSPRFRKCGPKVSSFAGASRPENLASITRSRARNRGLGRLCALLAGAGGVGLQRADALGEAFRRPRAG